MTLRSPFGGSTLFILIGKIPAIHHLQENPQLPD
jgi:hypothetical protein